MNDFHDPIEAPLRDTPYLDDGGFTEGVLETLPPRRPDRRGAILLVAGAVAGAVGAAALGEPIVAGAVVLSATGVTGLLLGGAVLALATGALLRAGR
jgi:hypothetical protein